MRVPVRPPPFSAAFLDAALIERMVSPVVKAFIQNANDKYHHWDKLRHHPVPDGLTAEQAWAAVDLARTSQIQPLNITFGRTGKLRYWTPPQHQEWISKIDQQAGGFLGRHGAIPDDSERHLFNSLMEEAIASSQLEGATTTREVAKEMLRTGRRPKDKAEQMILNNYRAILDIRDRRNDSLTPGLLRHLQKVLTEKTLGTPDAGGRFRRGDEPIVVVDRTTNETLHAPPDASLVAERVQEICDFANSKSATFVHPIIKAIALHFAIGYVHPFVDGNGRTARAVFYWFMLKSGFWLFEYLPLSRLIVNSHVRYGRAYLYTETDGGDLTYFSHYCLEVVVRAIDDLHAYLADQQRLLSEASALLDTYPQLNHRQRALVQNALKNAQKQCTITEYRGAHRVSYNTARSDLMELAVLGLLVRTKLPRVKEVVFSAAKDLAKRLRRPTSGRPRPASDLLEDLLDH